jgi:hypothetical protein
MNDGGEIARPALAPGPPTDRMRGGSHVRSVLAKHFPAKTTMESMNGTIRDHPVAGHAPTARFGETNLFGESE